jgi:hypothetical protein
MSTDVPRMPADRHNLRDRADLAQSMNSRPAAQSLLFRHRVFCAWRRGCMRVRGGSSLTRREHDES